jgi:hypothetical protein
MRSPTVLTDGPGQMARTLGACAALSVLAVCSTRCGSEGATPSPGASATPTPLEAAREKVLSTDAYNKFIEDLFLGGQRIDPARDEADRVLPITSNRPVPGRLRYGSFPRGPNGSGNDPWRGYISRTIASAAAAGSAASVIGRPTTM